MKMQITNYRRASHMTARIYLVFRDLSSRVSQTQPDRLTCRSPTRHQFVPAPAVSHTARVLGHVRGGRMPLCFVPQSFHHRSRIHCAGHDERLNGQSQCSMWPQEVSVQPRATDSKSRFFLSGKRRNPLWIWIADPCTRGCH